MRHTRLGFTLIELLVALVITAIIAAIAIPSYTQNIQKSRRSDGITSLLSMELAEEKYRVNNTQYGDINAVWAGVTASAQGYYTLSISNLSGTSFTITADAVGAQSADNASGVSCASLSIAVSNGIDVKSPSACWS